MSELNNVETTVGKVGGQILTYSAEAPGLFERYFVFVLVFIVACVISFGAGYLYAKHRDEVKQAGTAAVVATADAVASATVATADTGTASRLQSKLAAAQARAASLQTQIEAARNANPPAATCNLPVGLRDSLNSDLATSAGQVQTAVP